MKIQRKHIGTSNKLRVISTNGSHGAHQRFSVEPGETYTFEIDLHRPAGMNKEINVVIWKNTGPSGALSVHVLNVDGTNTFTYNATSSEIFVQIPGEYDDPRENNTFHGMGHVLFQKVSEQEKVIDFDNVSRSVTGATKRPIDPGHRNK